MKLSNLMIASLGAVALMGCDDGDKTPADPGTPEAAVYNIEGKYWDVGIASAGTVSAAADASNIIAYYFDDSTDKVKIYEATHYTEESYTVNGDEQNLDVGDISFAYAGDTITCDFDTASGALTLTSCKDGAAADADTFNLDGVSQASDSDVSDILDKIEPMPEAGEEGQSILMLDNSTADAPKLAYIPATGLTEGRVSVDVYFPFGKDKDLTFYYSLKSAAGTDDNSIAQIEMKKSNDRVGIKQRGGSYEAYFDANTFANLSIAFDQTNYTVYVDDVEAFTKPLMNPGAVEEVYFKFGTNGDTDANGLYLDNFKVFSDKAGTTSLFADNFEQYDNTLVGSPFSGIGTDYEHYNDIATLTDEQNKADDSTSPEIPEPSGVTDDFDSYTVGAQIDAANDIYAVSMGEGDSAVISNEQKNSGSNSLKLVDVSAAKPTVAREFSAGVAESGSVSVSVYIPEAGYNKATYLFLGGSATGSSSDRFTEVVFTSEVIKFRNEAAAQVALKDYVFDTWVDVTISWDGKNSDGMYPITLTINNEVITDIEGVPLLAEADNGAPKLMTLYVGDNSSTGTYSYFDDLDSELF